jgi:hypothetical protein
MHSKSVPDSPAESGPVSFESMKWGPSIQGKDSYGTKRLNAPVYLAPGARLSGPIRQRLQAQPGKPSAVLINGHREIEVWL